MGLRPIPPHPVCSGGAGCSRTAPSRQERARRPQWRGSCSGRRAPPCWPRVRAQYCTALGSGPEVLIDALHALGPW